MGGAAGRLGNPARAGPDSRRGRPHRTRGDGSGTGSAGRGAMAGPQARRARGDARGAGSGPSRASRLTVADSRWEAGGGGSYAAHAAIAAPCATWAADAERLARAVAA